MFFLLFLFHFSHAKLFRQGLLPPPMTNVPVPQESWFNQTLDHFKPGDTRTWNQRYWINWEHFRPGGPVLLMIGGEGEANPVWLNAGSWLDYAKKNDAAMMLLEHRYYGKSHPTPDLSVKNLNWLSSKQALADLSRFVVEMQAAHNLTGKWIALGGSYPGSLAAWSRLKYPHLIAGAVSTSGPLRAKTNFYEYLEVVQNALETTKQGCSEVVKDALKRVKYLTAHRVGWSLLTKKFNLCTPFDGTVLTDVINLFESLIGNFEGIVQYNKDNREFEGAKWMNITVETLCNIMTNPTEGTSLERLKIVNDLSLLMAEEKCLDHTYKTQLEELQGTLWNQTAAVGGRQWTYQTCTEFGWYQSSESPLNPFGDIIPARFFEYMCSDIFGPRFDISLLERGVEDTNTYYGGLDIEVTNVVFVHGSIDPWHAMGITKTNKSGMEAIFIEGTAHCANMYPGSKDDPEQLKNARRRIGQLISQWVK
ncbi:putative serine protease F56F10.1 [Eurytemora carolleeae]|uniref:putative serine protease F56F10.1 n=1 Tax=Eurytemora carolleeae TaxID=1294199 RepID=UPI000C768EA6|nr:putative serine protease F56F10.1 [Eurytemora carolleeae]|eukprot:XP_023327712.1 putative serine protease F56F10.1 [Eurytemora affinis]